MTIKPKRTSLSSGGGATLLFLGRRNTEFVAHVEHDVAGEEEAGVPFGATLRIDRGIVPTAGVEEVFHVKGEGEPVFDE